MHNKAVLTAIKALVHPHRPSVTPVLSWLTPLTVRAHTNTHRHTLDDISHTDDFRAGKITEHICRSSIIIMNWTVANFHYRLSFRSICTPFPFLPRHFLPLTHGVIYTFMTLKYEPVYREELLPCLQTDSLQFSLF